MRTIIYTAFITMIALCAETASAATLSWVPGTGAFNIGDTITLDLKINSEGVGVNAAQATIRFPKDALQVDTLDKTNSAFNFWLEEPTFSNTDGVISFAGGTPYGISGASIEVLKVTFIAKSVGTPVISITDSAVTASDGTGTNVLSKTNDATITISPTITTPTPVITPPVQITREPAPAVGLPAKPTVRVALYPNSTEWYNVSNTFTAAWDLPRDISGVSTAINKQPNYTPTESEGLFDSKSFASLTDGVRYLHVRFKNDIGWGTTAHYRLGVDTQAPIPFEVTLSESTPSDNPLLILKFKTTDSLSGVKEYRIVIDGANVDTVAASNFTGSYKLPLQTPGKHHLTIRATDFAGNGIETSFDFETLPILSPAFTFVPSTFFSDELKGLTLKGTSPASTTVHIFLKREDAIVAENTLTPDTHGNWEYTESDPLRNGTYTAIIQAKDVRGALSLSVTSSKITVIDTPVLTIGSLSLGKNGTIILLIFILLIGFGLWYMIYKHRLEKTALRVELAESDTAKVFKIIEHDIDNLDKARGTPTSVDDQFASSKLRGNVKKMGEYLKKEIGRAKE